MYNKDSKYPFLNEQLAKEAHIEDILSEIESIQTNWLNNDSNELATIASLNDSRNIKIPISPRRLPNIQYLVDLLVKSHPNEIRPVFSFKFSMNQTNKNLKFEEKVEYTLMMKETQFNHLQAERDKESAESFNELIKGFRFFNLTKLITKAQYKDHLLHLIKNKLGDNIFGLKYFALDNNELVFAEDYCFHKDNYDSVKSKLDFDGLKRIIALNEPLVNRHLKSYGILNTQVTDYRDNKLDYILNILADSLTQSFHKSDEVKIKNFKHLRECLIKIEKLLDPVTRLDSEILAHVQEKFMTTDKEIISLFPDMTPELLNQWGQNKTASDELIIHNDNNIKYFFDPRQFIEKYEALIKPIIYKDTSQKTDESNQDKNIDIANAELLTNVGIYLLENNQNVQKLFGTAENVETLKHLISRYTYSKKKINKKPAVSESAEKEKSLAFFSRLIYYIIIYFKKRKRRKQKKAQEAKEAPKSKKSKPGMSKETKDIMRAIVLRDAPIIPLSDFIEIKPENDGLIERIIADMRQYNLKIVVPIYNAKQNLYTRRSKNYLVSDIEYLMIDPEHAATSESIYEYIESITGFQLKEDTLTGNNLLVIEKYLLSIYRRAKTLKKKK